MHGPRKVDPRRCVNIRLGKPDKEGKRTVWCELASGKWVRQSRLTPTRASAKGARGMRRLRIVRRAYRRKDGALVKGTTYFTADKGSPARTPRVKKWFAPKVKSGWSKNLPASVRRARVLRAHGGDLLAAGRSKIQLANVSTDPTTKRLARADGDYFLRKYRASKR